VALSSHQYHKFFAKSLSSAILDVAFSVAMGTKYFPFCSFDSTSGDVARYNAVAAASVGDCPTTWNSPFTVLPAIVPRRSFQVSIAVVGTLAALVFSEVAL
jgi:hypothetical protein